MFHNFTSAIAYNSFFIVTCLIMLQASKNINIFAEKESSIKETAPSKVESFLMMLFDPN